jgi:hypothetical protein
MCPLNIQISKFIIHKRSPVNWRLIRMLGKEMLIVAGKILFLHKIFKFMNFKLYFRDFFIMFIY